MVFGILKHFGKVDTVMANHTKKSKLVPYANVTKFTGNFFTCF